MTNQAVSKQIYHLYAEDGFEGSAKTLEAALRSAQRMANKGRCVISVVQTDVHGTSGAGRGREITKVEPKRRGAR